MLYLVDASVPRSYYFRHPLHAIQHGPDLPVIMNEDERVNGALEGLSVNNNGISPQHTAVKEENADSTSSTSILSSKGPNSRSLSPDAAKSQSDGGASTPEVAPRPKMSRKASQKAAPIPATLFTHLPDVTAESKEHFEVIESCMYGSKILGSSKQDALDCDCSEEWRKNPAPFPS